MRARFAALALIGGLVAGGALAHTDRILERASDGSLKGLPKEYEPAAIEIGPAVNNVLGRPVPRVVVRLSGVENVVEPCVAELFLRSKTPAMRVSASWYHDFALLPPYVLVQLPSQTIEHEMFSGYSILFDLRTAKIIELRMQVATSGADTESGTPGFGASTRSLQAYEAICGERSSSKD
jgi:hypothetical protein